MKSQGIKVQIARGTLERNVEIMRLYRDGTKQADLARQFHVTRQYINQIVQRGYYGDFNIEST